jgi:hypothetical protein
MENPSDLAHDESSEKCNSEEQPHSTSGENHSCNNKAGRKRSLCELSDDDTQVLRPPKRQLRALNTQSPSNTIRCPLCGLEINRTSLNVRKFGRQSSFRQKKEFCEAHRRKDARRAWNRRGYPQIIWEFLEERFAKFHPVLDHVLQNDVQHHNKSLKVDVINQISLATAGYYGPRGLNLM